MRPTKYRAPKIRRAAGPSAPSDALLFRSIIRSAKDFAIFSVDMEGRITSWNEGAERLSGFRADAVIGKPGSLVFVPEDRAMKEPEKELETARSEGRALNERWHLKKDGSRFWGSGFVRPLIDDDGRQIGFVKIMRDLTDRKRLADQLSLKAAELEEFGHVLAHDLQSPVNKIRSFSDLLKTRAYERLDASEKGFLDRIINAADRMSGLIQDVLSLAKTVDPGAAVERVNLREVVAGVISDLEVEVTTRRAKVEVAELPDVKAHPTQMHQLFLNLIGNALKFSKPGEAPHVTVASRHIRGGLWEITVADNGIGFDDAQADRLFKPFSRLHPAANVKGSGIGLARCKKIVEYHGGTISVKAKPDRGAKFTFTLPQIND